MGAYMQRAKKDWILWRGWGLRTECAIFRAQMILPPAARKGQRAGLADPLMQSETARSIRPGAASALNRGCRFDTGPAASRNKEDEL
jgi:hypothetical protein